MVVGRGTDCRRSAGGPGFLPGWRGSPLAAGASVKKYPGAEPKRDSGNGLAGACRSWLCAVRDRVVAPERTMGADLPRDDPGRGAFWYLGLWLEGNHRPRAPIGESGAGLAWAGQSSKLSILSLRAYGVQCRLLRLVTFRELANRTALFFDPDFRRVHSDLSGCALFLRRHRGDAARHFISGDRGPICFAADENSCAGAVN